MAKKPNFSGVIAPVLTPFGEDGAPDAERFVEHCQWLLEEGCTGLAPVRHHQRGQLAGRRRAHGAAGGAGRRRTSMPAKLMPGTGSCSLADAIVLTKHAVDLGCGGVLMLPPFYYKAPSEEGLFRFFARGDRGGRRRRAQGLPLPHPAGGPGRLLAAADRPADQGIPRDRRRPQGLLGRLEQHRRRSSRPIRASRCSRARRCSCSTA